MSTDDQNFKTSSNDKIDKYIERPQEMKDQSLSEYIKNISKKRRRKLRRINKGIE